VLHSQPRYPVRLTPRLAPSGRRLGSAQWGTRQSGVDRSSGPVIEAWLASRGTRRRLLLPTSR
jgi:hypothetical protein